MKRKPPAPSFPILLANHQTGVPLDLRRMEPLLHVILAAVRGLPPGPAQAALADLGEIEVSILDDVEIARQHGVFLGDPTPTDVITFQHGEILVSADTALREASRFPHPVERELLLYVVHGMLHLHGYDDHSGRERTQMQALQDQILLQLWPEC